MASHFKCHLGGEITTVENLARSHPAEAAVAWIKVTACVLRLPSTIIVADRGRQSVTEDVPHWTSDADHQQVSVWSSVATNVWGWNKSWGAARNCNHGRWQMSEITVALATRKLAAVETSSSLLHWLPIVETDMTLLVQLRVILYIIDFNTWSMWCKPGFTSHVQTYTVFFFSSTSVVLLMNTLFTVYAGRLWCLSSYFYTVTLESTQKYEIWSFTVWLHFHSQELRMSHTPPAGRAKVLLTQLHDKTAPRLRRPMTLSWARSHKRRPTCLIQMLRSCFQKANIGTQLKSSHLLPRQLFQGTFPPLSEPVYYQLCTLLLFFPLITKSILYKVQPCREK